MIRFVVGLAIVAIILVAVVALRMRTSAWVTCSRCKGEGTWEGVRMRERCDACDGTGRVRRSGSLD